MSTYLEEYKRKLISVEKAAQLVKSGNTVEYGMFATKPIDFDYALGQRAGIGLEKVSIRGTGTAKNGKSLIALPSTYKDKEDKVRSRIVPMFPTGTVVTTSRNDVEWVVTEYGAVRLTNKPVSHRVKSLISIAHPDFRDELNFMARKQLWIR